MTEPDWKQQIEKATSWQNSSTNHQIENRFLITANPDLVGASAHCRNAAPLLLSRQGLVRLHHDLLHALDDVRVLGGDVVGFTEVLFQIKELELLLRFHLPA